MVAPAIEAQEAMDGVHGKPKSPLASLVSLEHP